MLSMPYPFAECEINDYVIQKKTYETDFIMVKNKEQYT